jgi:hypothetical protein
MSDTGSGAGSREEPPNPFSREGASSAEALGRNVPPTTPAAPAQDSWPTYPAAPLPPPGFDPEPVPPYPSTSGYEAAPVDGAYGSNPYEVNPYQISPYQAGLYQPSYGGSSPYGFVPTQHPQAITALVLGILGAVFGVSCGVGGLFGIGGIVLGRRARREIDAEPGRFTGRGAATAGIVTGIIGLVVGVLYAIFIVAMFTISDTGDF